MTYEGILPWREAAGRLLSWWKGNKRIFPWRFTRDPYRVLLAAVLLRRTDARKVLPIYNCLLERYPSIEALARASAEELADVLKPLGLYNLRARELKDIASELTSKYGGRIPDDPEELMKIKGVGRYIASAVACFAYGKPVPVIDSLVARVISRLLGLEVRTPYASREVLSAAEELIRCGPAKDLNLALMDLAVAVCLPRNPRCLECPLRSFCKFFEGLNRRQD